MSGEFDTLGSFRIFSTFLRYLGFLAFSIGIEVGTFSGIIVVGSNIRIGFYSIFVIIFILLTSAVIIGNTKAKVLLSSLLIIFYLFLLALSFPYFRLTLFFLIPLIIELRDFSSNFHFRSAYGLQLLAIGVAIFVMLLISGLIRIFPSTQSLGILVASISDDVTPGGTPLLFLGGMVFFTNYVVFSISLQALLLFSALSYLLVENYFLIIRFVRGNSRSVISGQISGALTVLSCQCESITAAFPSIVSLILSAIVLPLILESIVLVFLTNYLLRNMYLKERRVGFFDRIYPVEKGSRIILPASVLIIGLPLLETFGVYLQWQTNLYFFGSMNFLMLLAGIFAGFLLEKAQVLKPKFSGTRLPVFLVLVSSIVMLVWFYPEITRLTVDNGVVFAMMTIVSFAGGILSGIAYIGSGGEGRRLFLEFLAMMFTMFAIVVFYVSILFGYSIWNTFGLTEQIIFSIAVWVFSLPFMWFATNIALNSSVRSVGAYTNAE